jgi:hypothetical protein
MLPIADLPNWAAAHAFRNVHRSLRVQHDSGAVVGPFLVDIDVDEGGCEPDGGPRAGLLTQAAKVASLVQSYYESVGIPREHRRTYFSGRRGFHVEVVFAERRGLHLPPLAWRPEVNKLRAMTRDLRALPGGNETIFIDRPHAHKRLNGSLNAWGPPGSRHVHRVVRVDEANLADLDEVALLESASQSRC